MYAQNNGKITGTVVDSQTGESLIGVNVVIEGTIKGTATDIDGRYTIRNVEPGTYTIVVSYLSFATQTITNVVVDQGQTLTLDILLQEETEFLDEIVVTADVVLNNEAGLLRQRQKSIAFSDAISAESIAKAGSGDAAGALKKVVGASVVGGKYVYVRGLGDRYSSIQMNGVELPSTDPDRKTFQLDLIPSGLLENINTVKTFTPDKPGSFSGGIVDINTKAFPEQLQFKFSTSFKYNTQSSFRDDFISDNVSDSDWFGQDDGQRAIPSIFTDPDLVIPNEVQARFNDSLATIIDNTSRAFNETMSPVERSIPLDMGYSLSLGNQTQLFGNDLGYIASLSYGRAYSYYDNGETARYNLTSSDADGLTTLQQYRDRVGSDEVNIGVLFGLQYKLNNSQKIGLTYFKTQSGSNTGRIQEGIWPDELGFPEEGIFQQRTNTVTSYTERTLDYVQFTGDHYFENLLQAKLDWSASFAETKQEQPDLRFVSFFFNQNFAGADTNKIISTAGFADPSRLFRDLTEINTNYAVNLEIPFQLLSTGPSKLKVGGSYRSVEREFRENYFFILPDQRLFFDLEGDLEEFFSLQYRGVIDRNPNTNRPIFGNIVSDNTQDRNNYDANTEISAFYGMVEIPISNKLKFVGGARYETAVMEVASFDTSIVVEIIDGEQVETRLGEGKIDNKDWLPSLGLIYSINDNSNIRASWTRTIARPTAREIAPFSSFEFIGDEARQGNPDLKRTLITNYDFRFEIFPRPSEVFAISAFYKNLENPIELGFRPGAIATNAIMQWQNVDEAEIIGLEFEVRKNLDFIADFTENLSIGANVSLINSSIDLPPEELAQRADSTQTTRELQGQSPYIINVNFGYDNIDNGLSIGVYYNVFGQRLSNVGFGLNPDIFEQPRPQLDFISSKQFNQIQVSFEVKNILDAVTSFEYDFRGQNAVFQDYQDGISFSLGISYNL